MAYIGTSPTQAVRTRFLYTATASQTTFSGADTQNLTLRYSDANFVDVYQNGVLLKGGGADYTATTTTSVVLATGATADDVIEIIVYDVFAVANLIKKDGDTVEGVINFNGKEITLDADFDTSITADTDDQIDIKIAGSDSLRIKANEIENVSGDFTLDSAGDVILSAAGGEVRFDDGSQQEFVVDMNDADTKTVLRTLVSDADLVFEGNDGGVGFTALTLDMSEAGNASFNGTVTANAGVVVDNITIDGTEIDLSSGDLTLDVSADIILDADGGDVHFQDNGSSNRFMSIKNSSGSCIFSNPFADGDITFQGNDAGVGAVNAMFIDMSAGGLVGIGTTSAAAKLHVQSGDGSITPSVHADELLVEGSANAGITVGSGTSGLGSLRFADSGGDSQGNITYNHSDNSFSFATDDTEAIKIDSSQRISFGNNNPSDDTPGIGIQFDLSSSTTSFMNIGHTTGAGTSDGFVRFLRNSSIIGQIRTDGVSNVQYATSSDYRLKENIVTEWDATTRLKQLKPSRFNFKEEKDRTRDGFIAHEVSSIVPEAVGGEKDAVDKDGKIDPQTIDHSKLVPLLTKSLQEAIARIDTLEAEVKTLKGA